MTDAAKAQDDKQQIKSKKRVADFGEVFTAEREVNAMLNLLPETIWHNITATFWSLRVAMAIFWQRF